MTVPLEFIGKLSHPGMTKMLLVVLDGLGGLPGGPDHVTELQQAKTPNLDRLAPGAVLGQIDPVSPGITPGSGPGHLGLFGYDPVRYMIGRGVLSAAGLGLEMQAGDVAARINFCTVDGDGKVTDRRAGRIPTETCVRLCEKLSREVKLDGVTAVVKPEREHRAAVLFRGEGLHPGITDTDPQREGLEPLEPRPTVVQAERTAIVVRKFIDQVRRILAADAPANMVLLRGFDTPPQLPQYKDVFRVQAAAVAVYPMYRGIAKLVGMTVIGFDGETVADEVSQVEKIWKDFEFVYMHVKKTDSYGEDGNRDAKAHVIEEFDAQLPRLLALRPDVLMITGDHSTPAALKSHSWHPSPLLLAASTCRPDGHPRFTELNCARGGLGRIHATELMPLALAHALRLDKYGA
jgi:2,3-bisphosphoglycerate-independent phosphoglycerate mutase